MSTPVPADLDAPAILLVGISGYARSGKNTAAEPLVGYGFAGASFAEPLKELALRVNPVVKADGLRLAELVEHDGWESAKDLYPEVRRFLVALGDEARNLIGQDVWVDTALSRLGGARAVFTDTRYPNEADAIRERGGVLVRIDRPGVGPALDGDGRPYVSETLLDDYHFDLRVTNDGTLAQLQWAVMFGLQEIADRRRGHSELARVAA